MIKETGIASALRALLLTLLAAVPLRAQMTPVEVPLKVVQIQTEHGHLLNKVGLWAKVGGPGARTRFYQLDTGAPGMMAAFAIDPAPGQWWGSSVQLTGVTGTAAYGSGVKLSFDVVKTDVTLTDELGNDLVTIPTAAIGRVETAENPVDWQASTLGGQPPLHNVFFGNLGADLNAKHTSQDGTELFTVLAQLPQAGGFVISLPTPGQPGSAGTLTVGINDEMRAAFPYATPLEAEGKQFPSSGYGTAKEFNVRTTCTIGTDASAQTLSALPTVLDTGGPSTAIDAAVNEGWLTEGRHIKPGTDFSMAFAEAPDAGKPYTLSYKAGQQQSVDHVRVGDPGKNRVNAGLNPYAYADIMFDLEKGVVRFRPRQ